MFNNTRVVPHVEEGALIESTVASTITSTVILDLPTIHATRIDVIVESIINDAVVTLLCFGAAKKANTTTVLGTVTAGNTTGFTYGDTAGEFVGQVCQLDITNNNGQATGASLICTVWVGARS
jgi:hypothetical protein